MEAIERTQDGNGDAAETGTGPGVETRGRTQDENGDGSEDRNEVTSRYGDGNGDGIGDGNYSSTGDGNGDGHSPRIVLRTRAQGRETKHRIGEGGGEAKKRKNRHISCRRDVGNGGDLGGERKKRRQESVG